MRKVKAFSHRFGIAPVAGAAIVLLGACSAFTPSQRFEDAAARAGLESGTIDGRPFRHRIFTTPARGERLHVYFGGDGTPFLNRDRVARDPTPREPVTLELMRRDPYPAVFLGRPCYHALMRRCDPGLWTIGRYSETVVASMAAATASLIEARPARTVVLVGYSGGGVLALLVAERLPRVDAVVTLAANLDIDAWTQQHGYSALTASINPASVAGSRPDLVHLHLSGDRDDNVPPAVQARVLARLPPSSALTVAGFDHRCCWRELWPRPLAELDRRLAEMAQKDSLRASDT